MTQEEGTGQLGWKEECCPGQSEGGRGYFRQWKEQGEDTKVQKNLEGLGGAVIERQDAVVPETVGSPAWLPGVTSQLCHVVAVGWARGTASLHIRVPVEKMQITIGFCEIYMAQYV